jgi:Ca-activated chloride channel homolog
MARYAEYFFKKQICVVLVLIVLALTTVLAARASGRQDDSKPSQVTEGCLLYRSPISGRFDPVPLIHTDVVLDVRGLVASATVTQQYANSSTEPIEAVYLFPLPHDAAVYDMEIRIGNRVVRSTIREREEAKRVYEAAKSTGKRAALVEQERPNIFTTSVANMFACVTFSPYSGRTAVCGWSFPWSSVLDTFPEPLRLGMLEPDGR